MLRLAGFGSGARWKISQIQRLVIHICLKEEKVGCFVQM